MPELETTPYIEEILPPIVAVPAPETASVATILLPVIEPEALIEECGDENNVSPPKNEARCAYVHGGTN